MIMSFLTKRVAILVLTIPFPIVRMEVFLSCSAFQGSTSFSAWSRHIGWGYGYSKIISKSLPQSGYSQFDLIFANLYSCYNREFLTERPKENSSNEIGC